MIKLGLALALALAVTPAGAQEKATTILFVGNSFTFGANSAAHYYKPDTVTDLNGPGANGKTVGGVPAMFKALTKEAGLDYTVSLETVGGKGMDFHYAEKRALLDKPWDVVVMHGYSTLDIDHPGNPALLISSNKVVVIDGGPGNANAEDASALLVEHELGETVHTIDADSAAARAPGELRNFDVATVGLSLRFGQPGPRNFRIGEDDSGNRQRREHRLATQDGFHRDACFV